MNAQKDKQTPEKCGETIFFKKLQIFYYSKKKEVFSSVFWGRGQFFHSFTLPRPLALLPSCEGAVFPLRSQCLARSGWSVHGSGGCEWLYEFRGVKELRCLWRRDQLHSGHRATGSTSVEGVCGAELGSAY